MSEIGEAFKEWREVNKAKRASNKELSTDLLLEKGIEFESKNGGVHLIVKGKTCLIDYWPSTGKFITRNGKKGRGVFKLLSHC